MTEMQEAELAALKEHVRGDHREARNESCPACRSVGPAETPKTPKEPRTTPTTGNLCECGCGEPVARRFLPGHDAKLKSRLRREARAGSADAMAELLRRRWG